MNTPKTGMRTILAAAAAGALVLGSAAGVATAAPGKGKGPKAPKPQLQVVNIKGHSPLNVFDLKTDDGDGMSLRDLTLRATVRDKADAVAPAATVQVQLDAYTKKVAGDPIPNFEPITVTLTRKDTKSKVNKQFEYTLEATPELGALLAGLLAPGGDPTPYLCIATADVVGYDGETWSNQTKKRLGQKGKAVRDCVKIVNVDPATTDTKTDDDPAPTDAPTA